SAVFIFSRLFQDLWLWSAFYIMEAVNNGFVLNFQVRGMLTDFGDDMHCQFNDILRSLLDSYASGLQCFWKHEAEKKQQRSDSLNARSKVLASLK
ncbi:hypothetical protein MTR67_003165, partial [Solanum verrucosum]